MDPKKLVVIGGGLIGGSIGAALKDNPRWRCDCLDVADRVDGIARSDIFERVAPIGKLDQIVSDADMVVVATGVEAVCETVGLIAQHLKDGCVVVDVGSTKQLIVDEARRLLPSCVSFVGGHPMAGKEKSGVGAADRTLFKNKPFILCPTLNCDEGALIRVLDLVDDLGAMPVSMEAHEHDRVVAFVSHLPQLISVALMAASVKQDADHGVLDLLAGPGFMDMTRVAASDFGTWEGILNTNRESIGEALDLFGGCVGELRERLDQGNLQTLWSAAAARRKKMNQAPPDRDSERDLRGFIDNLDAQLIEVVARRFEIVEHIGKVKKKKGLDVADPKREEHLLAKWKETAAGTGLPTKLLVDLFKVMVKHSKALQSGSQHDLL